MIAGGHAVEGSAFELDAGAGLLRRHLRRPKAVPGAPPTIVVTYVAGFRDRSRRSRPRGDRPLSRSSGRLPSETRCSSAIVSDDLGEQEFWVGGGMGRCAREAPSRRPFRPMLDPYRTPWRRMTPEAAIAVARPAVAPPARPRRCAASLHLVGNDQDLRRRHSSASSCKGYAPDELVGVTQGDSAVVMAPTQIKAAGWPSGAPEPRKPETRWWRPAGHAL